MDNFKNSKQIKAYLETFVPFLPGYAYFKDPNGTYLSCNDLLAKAAGLDTCYEIVDKNDSDMPWRIQKDEIRRTELATLKTFLNQIFEETLSLADGSIAIFLSNKKTLRDEKGQIIGILVMLSNITQLKQRENTLYAEQDQTKIALANILDNIPAHIFWKDRNCILLGCNDLQAKNMGFSSAKEMIGKSNSEVIVPTQPEETRRAQAEAITKLDLEVMQTGKTYVAEEPLILPDGTTAIYLSKKTPLRNEKGDIIGLLGIAFDITKHKLDGMLLVSANIAHELRTPLRTIHSSASGIKGYLPRLIESYHLATQAKLELPEINPRHLKTLFKACTIIEDEAQAAFTIINILLMNIKPDGMTKDFKQCSINHCIEEALKRYPFDRAESELVQWKHKKDFDFYGNELLVVHIIFNLIKNALYQVKGAGKGQIEIWTELSLNSHTLHFKDTAKGIASDILPHIFNRFFSRSHHGTGIGLTFCRTVMESLGGSIACYSLEGKYTEFVLNFPLKNF